MYRDKREIAIVIGCVIVIIAVIICTTLIAVNSNKQSDQIVINDLKINSYDDFVSNTTTLTVTEFETFEASGSESSFSTSEGFSSTSPVTVQTSTSKSVSYANKELYEISNEYFDVTYGSTKVSPLFPMALANVETPSRADNSKTWSALFPSKYVDVSLMRTFCVTDVVKDETIFKALSSEVSTRDRGALQMSPTYGTNYDYINKMMSGAEKAKLKTVDNNGHASWVSGASDSPGDRFYLPDVLLRMRGASTKQIENMIKNDYQPSSDLQLIAMLAMGHHSSGVWYHSNHSKSVGCWKSGEAAFTYASKFSDDAFTDKIIAYAKQSNKLYIDSNTAKSIYSSVYTDSLNTYATKDIVCTYPIKAVYAYVKLSLLYNE